MRRRRGPGSKSLSGIRSRGRVCVKPFAGAPSGAKNGNYLDDDAAHSLAISLMALGEAVSKNRAAQMAVMLREGINPDARSWRWIRDSPLPRNDALIGEARRIYDKLRKDASLAEHIVKVREMIAQSDDLQTGIEAHRARLSDAAA